MNTRQMITRAPVVVKKVIGLRLNLFEMLKVDHMKVEALFLRLRSTHGEKDRKLRGEIFDEIRRSLEEHMDLEEKVFYSECLKHAELRPIALEASEEHRQIRNLLRELQRSRLGLGDEKAEAKLTVMFDDIQHHVEEEETEFFPMVKRTLGREQIRRLGEEIRKRRERRRVAAAKAA